MTKSLRLEQRFIIGADLRANHQRRSAQSHSILPSSPDLNAWAWAIGAAADQRLKG
ncbi:hypothetical protein [Pseudomonas antarctica]|uniref:hypothetical protein n=1 Tax=Pseudomonas antarctica TaxID=219572 RepID=UPI0012EB001E|nr:hypothetical protein [Pseudomonas antarctica]